MRAEWDDIPSHVLKRRKKPRLAIALILLSPLFTFAALFLPQPPFYQGFTPQQAVNNVKALVSPKPVQQVIVYSSIDEMPSEERKFFEEHVRRQKQLREQQTLKAQQPPARQTVFNDDNYIPRGADNVVSFPVIPKKIEDKLPKRPKEIVVVGKERRISDYCPYREGSLERRSCKANIKLSTRNTKMREFINQ